MHRIDQNKKTNVFYIIRNSVEEKILHLAAYHNHSLYFECTCRTNLRSSTEAMLVQGVDT